jgi:hypothetical protein
VHYGVSRAAWMVGALKSSRADPSPSHAEHGLDDSMVCSAQDDAFLEDSDW